MLKAYYNQNLYSRKIHNKHDIVNNYFMTIIQLPDKQSL